MPTMTMLHKGMSAEEIALSIESVSNVTVMSISFAGEYATVYYITNEATEIDQFPSSEEWFENEDGFRDQCE